MPRSARGVALQSDPVLGQYSSGAECVLYIRAYVAPGQGRGLFPVILSRGELNMPLSRADPYGLPVPSSRVEAHTRSTEDKPTHHSGVKNPDEPAGERQES